MSQVWQRIVCTRFFHLICALMLLIPTGNLYSFSPYSNRQLDELEKVFVEQINQSPLVERNPLATEYVNAIGRRIAKEGQMRPPVFFIVKSPEINAFAGPGGYIGLNTQLILSTKTESELAGVMAHEIAHVRLHHLYRMLEHEKQMRIPMLASLLASVALGILNPAIGSGAMMASLSGFAQDNINYIRSNEKEADRDGIQMLKQAGFDPRGMAGFFKKMHETSRYHYMDNIPAILRTHPMDEDRIAEAENRTQNLPKSLTQDSVQYHLFKELIRNAVDRQSKYLIDFYRLECHKSIPLYACQYGQALSYINFNQFDKAQVLLAPLANSASNNPFYQIAMAKTEIGLKQNATGLERLEKLNQNTAENYANIMAYAQGLNDSAQYGKAAMVLLKGSRIFPGDLQLCLDMARSQAKNNQRAYAYLTQAQCLVLQGRRREAVYQLKQGTKYQTKDGYIQARISAKIDEIKSSL